MKDTVEINGKEKEMVWVDKQGGWDAHYEVDGVPFDGHRVAWSFSYEPKTYLKESELSGDEWRKGGSVKIYRNGICVMNEFCREPERAAIVVGRYLEKCMEVDWEKIQPGLKCYYNDVPSVIDRICDDGEIIFKTESGEDYPLWAFEQEDKKEGDLYRDWTNTTRDHATSHRISWWRK